MKKIIAMLMTIIMMVNLTSCALVRDSKGAPDRAKKSSISTEASTTKATTKATTEATTEAHSDKAETELQRQLDELQKQFNDLQTKAEADIQSKDAEIAELKARLETTTENTDEDATDKAELISLVEKADLTVEELTRVADIYNQVYHPSHHIRVVNGQLIAWLDEAIAESNPQGGLIKNTEGLYALRATSSGLAIRLTNDEIDGELVDAEMRLPMYDNMNVVMAYEDGTTRVGYLGSAKAGAMRQGLKGAKGKFAPLTTLEKRTAKWGKRDAALAESAVLTVENGEVVVAWLVSGEHATKRPTSTKPATKPAADPDVYIDDSEENIEIVEVEKIVEKTNTIYVDRPIYVDHPIYVPVTTPDSKPENNDKRPDDTQFVPGGDEGPKDQAIPENNQPRPDDTQFISDKAPEDMGSNSGNSTDSNKDNGPADMAENSNSNNNGPADMAENSNSNNNAPADMAENSNSNNNGPADMMEENNEPDEDFANSFC